MTEALYHAVTMALAPRGTTYESGEYGFWRRKAAEAIHAIQESGYVLAPAGSVQYYRWDDATQSLVRRKGKRIRSSAHLLRDAHRAGENDSGVGGKVRRPGRDDAA